MLKKGPQVSFEVYLETQKFSKSKTKFQFHWLDLVMILLMILGELGLGLLIEVEDGIKGYNFHLHCFR